MGRAKYYSHVHKFWLLRLLKDYGNFKEAANHAAITQSALSQNILFLENLFGRSLLIRQRGRVQLTDAGEQIINHVDPALDILNDMSEMDPESDDFKGEIRLGAYESLAISLLPGFLYRLQKRNPHLKIDVRISRTERLNKLVRSGDLDMALVIDGQTQQNVVADHLGSDSLALYVSAKHEIREMGLDSIGHCGIATISQGESGYPEYYKQFMNSLPVPSKIKVTCDSFEVIRKFATAGFVVGVLPSSVAERNEGDLIKIFPTSIEQDIAPRSNITLISRKTVDQRLKEMFTEELGRELNKTN